MTTERTKSLFHSHRPLKLRSAMFMLGLIALAGCLVVASGCADAEKPAVSSTQPEKTTPEKTAEEKPSGKATNDAEPDASGRPLPSPGSLPGLTEEKGGWMPEVTKVVARDSALRFPPIGDESYHIHALLSIFVDGKQMPIPNNIGVNQAEGFISSLHTHDASGVIHFEADDPFGFLLGDIFAVWGVVLTDDQIGGYKSGEDGELRVFVNGDPVKSFVTHVVRPKDNIVIAFGKTDDFPKEPSTEALDSQE